MSRLTRATGNIKHHMQTLCAMDLIDYKKKSTNAYEQLFMTLRKLRLGHEADVEVFRRMVFNIFGRNCDDHSKNFSFLLPLGGAWELAPAYDVTFAHNPKSEWTHQHLMSINGKYKDFTIEDLLGPADRFSIGEAPYVIEQVRKAIKKWPSFAKAAGVSKDEVKRIKNLHLLLS